MSPGTDPITVVAGVLAVLRQSRALLLDPSPRNIDCCRVAISQSVHRIVDLMQGDRSQWNKKELSESLQQVRGELGGISNLLDSAAALHRNRLKGISASTPSPVVEFDGDAVETVRRVHILG